MASAGMRESEQPEMKISIKLVHLCPVDNLHWRELPLHKGSKALRTCHVMEGKRKTAPLTNPQILRTLPSTQILKELRMLPLHLSNPLLVVLEDAIMALLEILAHLLRLLLVEVQVRHSACAS